MGKGKQEEKRDGEVAVEEAKNLTAKQKQATILLHHCHPMPASRAVTTGANTIVPNPEPQVDIPVTRDLFFSNQYPTAVTAGMYISPRPSPPNTP